MAWEGPNWMEVVQKHRESYSNDEEAKVEKAHKMYRGDSWGAEERGAAKDGVLKLVTYNLLFAVIETATAATVPTQLAFTVYEKAETPATIWEDYLTRAGRIGDWRGEACLSMVDAMLTGRSILKTTPSANGFPQIRAVDPRRVYFDLSVRRPCDIGYYIEFCPMTISSFRKRLRRVGKKAAVYKLPDTVNDVERFATAYPKWLSGPASKTSGQQWVPVYEVVDVANRTVTHWIEGVEEPLCEWTGEDYYNPYSIYNLNLNGQDNRGLSEVTLVEDTVAAINRLLVYWAEIIRRQVPITVYDSTRIDENEVTKIARAAPGSFVAVKSNGQPPLSAIQQLPVNQVPPNIIEFMQKLEQIVSFITAMSDMARGQVVGAKTATELAVIESKDKTRLQHRVSRFNSAWEDAARKAIELGRHTNPDWPDVWDLNMMAYSPMAMNREVLRERFLQAYPIMSGRPESFKQTEVDKEFVDVMGMSPRVLYTEEEREQMAQAAAAQMAPPPPPPPADAPVDPETPTQEVTAGPPESLPPQAVALLNAAQGEGA